MSARLGRNARIFIDGVIVGFIRNINVKDSVEMIKDYSNESTRPAVSGPGKQTITFSFEHLYTDGSLLTRLRNGTQFDIVIAPTGTSTEAPYETLTNCTLLNRDLIADSASGLLENGSGEAEDHVPTEAA